VAVEGGTLNGLGLAATMIYRTPNPATESCKWDTAYKADELSDYSVCTTGCAGNRYNLITFCAKSSYRTLGRRWIEHAEKFRAEWC